MQTQNAFLRGRAGRGRPAGAKPTILTVHIQEGTNYLPDYFPGVQADSTMWVDLAGRAVSHAPRHRYPRGRTAMLRRRCCTTPISMGIYGISRARRLTPTTTR